MIVSHTRVWISGSVIELIVRPGDNITLYCDCKTTPEQFIVWYRNCSHENQPSLVLKLKEELWNPNRNSVNSIPHFHFVKNHTSESYDLLIVNITGSDVGLYYCGTEEMKLEQKTKINHKYVYRYGSVTTRILFSKCSGVILFKNKINNLTNWLPPRRMYHHDAKSNINYVYNIEYMWNLGSLIMIQKNNSKWNYVQH